MNIDKMLEMQKQLDQFTIYERGGLEVYPRKEIELALRVELGELAQEWGKFKYWKKSRVMPNKEKMLEEWADCMHFALSLANNKTNTVFEIERDIEIVEGLFDIYDVFEIASRDLKAYQIVMLGDKLGFTNKEMKKAYYDKNKINWERMRGNY